MVEFGVQIPMAPVGIGKSVDAWRMADKRLFYKHLRETGVVQTACPERAENQSLQWEGNGI
jgi:hypothetical protein